MSLKGFMASILLPPPDSFLRYDDAKEPPIHETKIRPRNLCTRAALSQRRMYETVLSWMDCHKSIKSASVVGQTEMRCGELFQFESSSTPKKNLDALTLNMDFSELLEK